MAKERIGILGGAFDPIHQGHIAMAKAALDAKLADRLLVVPSGTPPYKSCIAPAEDRWRMVVAACTQDARLLPSRAEMDAPGEVFTLDTLKLLHSQFPKAEFLYLIGNDMLMKLANWHRAEEVWSLCSFLVYPRSSSLPPEALKQEKRRLEALGVKFQLLNVPPVPLSSTKARDALREGEKTPGLYLPVREYCDCMGLYEGERRIPGCESWMPKLFSALNPHRFAHSLAVAATSRQLAKLHGLDPQKAEIAGLLHDCAKCMPLKEMQHIALQNHLTDDQKILESGALMHSLVGAWLARQEYGIQDVEILEAIACHSTGRAGMGPLAVLICLTDSIEPTREDYPGLASIRLMAQLSPNRALLQSLERTAEYVQSRGKYLHPQTLDTIAWLRGL